MNTQPILRLATARRLSSSGEGRTLRTQAGLTLQEVATSVGVAISTLSRWENGQRSPRGEAAARWAQLLTDLKHEATAS